MIPKQKILVGGMAAMLLAALFGCDDEPSGWCPPTLTACDGGCYATSTDTKNCGACGTTCKTGEICQGGVCSSSCAGGTTLCSGACVDTQTNPKNCGSCGNGCKVGEVCTAGKCALACGGGTTLCSGVCVDTKVDPKNCGSCGNTCKTGEVCSSGKCTLNCPSGTVACSGVCTCTQLDPKNCGACGKACTSGQVCSVGKCGLTCVGGTTLCSGVCADTKVDTKNCGTCGNACKTGDICVAGKCKGVCGDGVIGTGEVCDGKTLGSQTCKTLKYTGGTLACATDCSKVDASGCTWAYVPVSTVPAEASSEMTGLAVGSDGSVFMVGTYPGTLTFGSTKLSTGGDEDAFVARVSPPGTPSYAVTLGGTSYDYGYGVAVDGSGNAAVVGTYRGTATFGTVKLTSKGFSDGFAAQLDKTGKVTWAVSIGGTGRGDDATGVATDSAGNVYVFGRFESSVTLGTTTLTAKGGSDWYVLKLDSKGKVLWAVSLGGTGYEYPGRIAVDNSGNATLVGVFSTAMTAGTTTLTPKGKSDVAVVRLDSTGKVTWSTSLGGTDSDDGAGVALDSSGNVFVVGSFRSSATFGNSVLTSKGGSDVFLAKLSSSGVVTWALSAGGTGTDYGVGVAVDSSGNPRIVGEFRNTVDFNGIRLTSNGYSDVFVAKVDSTPRFAWAASAGSTYFDEAGDVAVDSSGNTYAGGSLYGNASLGNVSVSPGSGVPPFVWKLDKDGK